MKSRGFSLIELLVVIAVIGLLATFAIVQISGSREKARVAKAVAHSAQILRALGDDLVTRWDFDECSGTSVADSSGLGNALPLSGGATFSTDTPNGSGCSMTGLTTRLTAPMTVSINGRNLTASAWFKTTNYGDQYMLLITYQILSTYLGTIRSCPTATQCFAGTTRVDDGKWHLMTFVGDGSSMRLYLDGEPNPEATRVWSVAVQDQLKVGPFSGFVDDIRLYNRALTKAEVQQLYAEGTRQYLAMP